MNWADLPATGGAGPRPHPHTPESWRSPESLAGRIYNTLRQRILTCELAPSDRLAGKHLCPELGVSQTPFREALNRLVLEGLVVTVPYRGYVVAPLTLQDIRDLCELRELVESEVAALAARRGDCVAIARLRKVAATRYTPGDPSSYWRYFQANSTFHLGIARAAGNRRLETVLAQVLDQIHRPFHLALDASALDDVAGVDEHLALLDQVLRRDARSARRTAREHCTRWGKRIVSIATKCLASEEHKEPNKAGHPPQFSAT